MLQTECKNLCGHFVLLCQKFMLHQVPEDNLPNCSSTVLDVAPRQRYFGI